MKRATFLKLMLYCLLLLSKTIVSQEISNEVKIYKFSAQGQIGDGRSAGYLPCYEPFYLKVNTNEIAGKKITQVKIYIYDSQGKKKNMVPTTKADSNTFESTTFTLNAKTNEINPTLYSNISNTWHPRVFSSVPSTKNELLIYIDAKLNYKRFYFIDYEISFVSEGEGAALAEATVTSGEVTAINVKSGGSYYSEAPTIIIAGGGGKDAEATAGINGGEITNIKITKPGTGYISIPKILIISKITGTIQQVYSLALKQDVTFVEAYTGLALPIFTTDKFNDPKLGFSFVAGAKIHLGPVYFHPMRGRYELHHASSRFSITIGTALGTLRYKNSEIKAISDFVKPALGLDFEPFEYFSIHTGVIMGVQESGLTSVSENRLVVGGFIGINITPKVFLEAGKNSSGFKFPIGTK